ncbi:MAG TPA: cell wall hydrolase [Firmicutes bacterium]|nr:cell wall hydrolase [Bacillota bacterium]
MTDLEILTRIIWGEAEAETLIGKVGVGASVINQANAENITILQVVQAPGQFEAYQNQRFYQAPYHTQEPAIVEAKQAANRALGGEDPTNGKTHFCAFQKNPCRWHYQQAPPSQILGQHVFVRARVYNSQQTAVD